MSRPDDATIAPSGVPTPQSSAFTPGQIVAGRYRMIGLLGRGGMGEVYRADDLTLGTTVALKFLPPDTERDEAALARFHAEVRIARQVSHPHVCRVFDIGTVGDRTFLSMEFVDGEDLATLLRRIGRLPPQKALELARQMCAGLSAAHEQGVLHRDLKPANIMVDGHGRARITDFGLAVVGAPQSAEFAGTPAYMAPEVLAGRAASTRSDLYALGLVLYEMFTGETPFRASTIHEWRRAHSDSVPPPPSTHVDDLDPIVERAILSCLEKEPERRPRSALSLALQLPGGDPLAAAVAAGETPSPEMVAAAGGEKAVSLQFARLGLGACALGLLVLILLAPYSSDYGLAPMTRGPDALRDRAQEIARAFGYTSDPIDEVGWLERDYEPMRWMADHMPSIESRRRLRENGTPVLFTVRRSDSPLMPEHVSGMVLVDSPPIAAGSGDVRVVVDGMGRLREFRANPHSRDNAASTGIPDIDVVFQRADLDRNRFTEVASSRVPPVAFDARREWEGSRANFPELPLHLSVAWFDGRIVWTELSGPWHVASTGSSSRSQIGQFVLASFILLTALTAGELVRRNLRAGRGDRKGAARLAAFTGALSAAAYVSQTNFAPAAPFGPVTLVFGTATRAVADGLFIWLLYMAIEPAGRRRVPSLLVGWARLLAGRFHDAGVARDVLIGLCAGIWLACVMHFVNALPSWIDLPTQTPVPGFTATSRVGGLINRVAPFAAMLGAVAGSLTTGLPLFLAVVIARTLLRPRLALAATGLIFIAVMLGSENPWVEVPYAIAAGCLMAWLANAFGLLAFLTLWAAWRVLSFGATLVIVPSTWMSPYAWATMVGLIALAVAAHRSATGGRMLAARGAVGLR